MSLNSYKQDEVWDRLVWATYRAQRDFPYFLRWTFTLDTAEGDPDNRIKRFPDKAYINEFAKALQSGPKLIHVPKTRQMMMSWLHAAWLTWGCMRPGYRGYVQSKKEIDSDEFIKDRIVFIWNHLPRWMRFIAMDGKGIECDPKYCQFRVPNGSKVYGVAQGGDQFRGYVPSAIFLDEVAYWDQFEESLAAIIPLLQKGARASCVSTARPGPWGEVVESPIQGKKHQIIRGLTMHQLEFGGHVFDLSYEADPDKDPKRDGAKWFKDEVAMTPGGFNGPIWQQEYERNFEAYSGELMHPGYRDEEPFICDPFVIPATWPKWRAGDWGNRNETAFVWVAQDPQSKVYYAYREFYEPSESVDNTKAILADMSEGETYQATWVDPATDRHESKEIASVFQLLNKEPMPLEARKGNRSRAGIELINIWLAHMEDGVEAPRFVVFKSLTNMRKEFLNYRYEDWANRDTNKNLKETPRKFMDHLMNANKYFANGVRYREVRASKPNKKKPKAEPGSFAWYKEKHLKKQRYSRTVGGPEVVRQLG